MESNIAIDHRDRVEDFRRRHRIGLLTLVFTDMVGSTRLKQTLGDSRGFERIQEHHDLVREILASFPEGEEIGTAGDSFFVVFSKPSEAVKFSLLLQARLRGSSQDPAERLSDRIGIHIGEVIIEERPGSSKPKDLYGIQVDICARLMGLGKGDQILMTRSTFDNARQVLKGQDLPSLGPLTWTSHGSYLLQGVDEPLEVCEVGETGFALLTAPADSGKARRASTTPVVAADEASGKKRGSSSSRNLALALGAIVVLGVAAVMMLKNRPHSDSAGTPAPAKTQRTVLFRDGFEKEDGHVAGQSLIGRNGWQRGAWQTQLASGGEGVGTGLLPGSSQQAFVGGVTGEKAPVVHASVRHSITFAADPGKASVLEIHLRQLITDSTQGGRNIFEWVFYSQQGRLLGGLNFDNATGKIVSRRPDNSISETNLTFERGRAYPLTLRMDFKAMSWTARIGEMDLGPLSFAGKDPNIGFIALTWRSSPNQTASPDGGLSGDNKIVFDDFEVVGVE